MSGSSLWNAIERTLRVEGERLAFDAEKSDGVSYARLRELTAAIASQLQGSGPVAILANRSFEAYLAVLACFRFGRTFVPLNPSFPPARLQSIVEHSGATECMFDLQYAKIAQELGLLATKIDLDLAGSDRVPDAPAAEDRVYHLFTSGSTGQPKGVPITHANLAHYVEHVVSTLKLEPHQRATQFFDLGFDLSMHDLFVTLSTGGTLVPASDMALMMPHRFVAANAIDIWFSVPLLAVAAARGQAAMPAEARLKKALFCGEALPGSYAKGMAPMMVSGGEIWNLYGPTEATIALTAHKLKEVDFDRSVVPLGRALGHNRIAVLGEDGVVEASDGAEGELLLGGPQVFGGYAPVNGSHPFVEEADGTSYYRTGDLVRIASGEVRYIGRTDSQVKIRGHRVELGEIESACAALPGVEAAAVVLLGDPANPKIVAAWQGDPEADFAPLKDRLAPYMVPKEAHLFDALPTNGNGKIDRRALKELL